jgi:hypothetical protein
LPVKPSVSGRVIARIDRTGRRLTAAEQLLATATGGTYRPSLVEVAVHAGEVLLTVAGATVYQASWCVLASGMSLSQVFPDDAASRVGQAGAAFKVALVALSYGVVANWRGTRDHERRNGSAVPNPLMA